MTRKKVLSLPEKLPTVLCQNTCNEVTKVWVYFKSIYEEINTWSHDKSADTFWNKTRDWLQTFLSLRDKRSGYEKKRITPYMHVLFAHVPFFLIHINVWKYLLVRELKKQWHCAECSQSHVKSLWFSRRQSQNWNLPMAFERQRKNKQKV